MLVRIITVTLAILGLSAGLAHATPTHLWSYRYVRTDDQWIEKLVVDPSGNIVVVGNFYSDLFLGELYTSLGFQDGFVAKFDPAGNLLWSHQIGGVRGDRVFDVAVDPVGNVICVGYLGVSPTDTDGIVVKYGPDGTERWFKQFGVGDNQPQAVMTVSTNLSKEIIIAGEFEGSIDVGGGPLLETGGRTYFMAKLGQPGNHVWSKRFVTDTPFAYNLSSLATATDGESVLFGNLYGSFDPGNGTLTTAGESDMFLARFDANGNALWAQRYGDAGRQFTRALAINESGQIAVVGSGDGTVNFGGGPLTATGGFDPCVAVFTPAGNHVWSKIFTGAGTQFAMSVTWASNQDVLMVSRGNGTLDFGGGPAPITSPATGVWLTRFFGASGTHRWSSTLTASLMDGQIEEDDGRIILGGGVGGTIDFGGGQTTGETDYLDLYLAKFGDALTGVLSPSLNARLDQNVPNPFNPRTTIPYTLDQAARVQIAIYNASGAIVAVLDEGMQPAGPHAVSWDGRDRTGKRAASGVYFYRLEGLAGESRKMVLLK